MNTRLRSEEAKKLGQQGETAACHFLQQKGFAITTTNWRPQGAQHGLELDIVATVKDTLVFVEVKTRTLPHGQGIPPAAAFTPAKQRKMVRAAQAYLAHYDLWHMPCQFDLVCVTFTPPHPPTLEHSSNVICLGHSLDSGNAAWQPW